MKRSMLALAIALGAAALPAVAHADPSAQDQAAAEGLFTGGKKLMAEGKYAEACPKFEESQRLDPAPGTQFKLGECYEHIGKIASAWALFLNVAAAAKSANMPDREKIARDRAAALEPKLPKLTIVVPSPVPGLEVKRDGVVVGAAQYGVPLAVDPGSHPITASAPQKEPWTSTADVLSGEATITIPALKDMAAALPAGKPTPAGGADSGGLGTQRTLALVAAGVGVVGLGVGTVFGLRDMSKLSDAESHCVGNSCDSAGVALRDEAIDAGNISTIAFGVGLVGLIGGAVLWLTAPPPGEQAKRSARSSSAVRIAPALGKSTAGMTLGGAF